MLPPHSWEDKFPNTNYPLEVHTNHAHLRRLSTFHVTQVYGHTATFTMANRRIRTKPVVVFLVFEEQPRLSPSLRQRTQATETGPKYEYERGERMV